MMTAILWTFLGITAALWDALTEGIRVWRGGEGRVERHRRALEEQYGVIHRHDPQKH